MTDLPPNWLHTAAARAIRGIVGRAYTNLVEFDRRENNDRLHRACSYMSDAIRELDDYIEWLDRKTRKEMMNRADNHNSN